MNARTFLSSSSSISGERCQVDFLPTYDLPELKRVLKKYKAFEVAKRHKTTIISKEYPVRESTYVRKRSRTSLIPERDLLQRLDSILGIKSETAPLLNSSRTWIGRVKDGFTLPLNSAVMLYRYHSNCQIPMLGAFFGNRPEHKVLTDAFAKLFRPPLLKARGDSRTSCMSLSNSKFGRRARKEGSMGRLGA